MGMQEDVGIQEGMGTEVGAAGLADTMGVKVDSNR